jgi:hypothetical protein
MRRMSPAILLIPLGAFAADLEFAGSLERTTPEAILIRLADGTRVNTKLPKTGALAAETITAQHKLADEVRITCKPMGQDKCLELKSITVSAAAYAQGAGASSRVAETGEIGATRTGARASSESGPRRQHAGLCCG